MRPLQLPPKEPTRGVAGMDSIPGTTTMQKRLQLSLAILCIGLLGVVAWLVVASNDEPRYEGKPLSQWLRELDFTGSPHPLETIRKADEALKAIGTNSFPYLEKMLCETDPRWKRGVIAFNAKQSLFRLPVTPAQVVRARALMGYHMLGPSAGADVPRLIQMMDSQTSSEVRCCIAEALGVIGPEARDAIPVLMKAVTSQNADVSRSAMLALHNIRRDARDTDLRR